MKPWIIYGLTDPTTGEIRYVGKTSTSLRKRLQGHMRESTSDGRGMNVRKNRWIRSITGRGMMPGIIEIEAGTGDWEEAERRWIAEYRERMGDRLTNAAPGGIAPPDNLHTRESFAKSARSRKGRKRATPFTAEHRANLSKAHKGYKHTEQWKKNHAAIMTGKILGPNSWEALQSQRLERIMRKFKVSEEIAKTYPGYFTTPEMIELALGRNSGNMMKTARDLHVPINMIRYYDPRKKLNVR